LEDFEVDKKEIIHIKECNEILKSLVKKYNIPFIELKNIDFQKSDFVDFVHLNEKGNKKKAKIIANCFTDIIKKKREL